MAGAGKLKNIGPVSTGWLREIGINSQEELEAMGAVEAYRQLRVLHPKRVSLNLLYGLEASLLGIPLNHLPQEIRDQLKAEAERE
jgi:DNA transformation protein and related proteins